MVERTSALSDPILLTVLIPCYNEAAIIEQTVGALRRYLENGNWRQEREGDWEILLVDDGSSDTTASILSCLARTSSQIRFISYPINAGQGQALRKGFDSAKGEWIFCVDADLDYSPDHIEQFFKIANTLGAQIVIGSPYMVGGSTTGVPVSRICMSRLMNWYFRKVLRLGFHTYTSILRLYNRDIIQQLLLSTMDKDLLPEIILRSALLGTPMVEAPAHLHWKKRNRVAGRPGAGVSATIQKAARHLLWGTIENPFFFFLLPATLISLATTWFGVALAILFFAAYNQTTLSGLAAITGAASDVVLSNPQTIVIFMALLNIALILFTLGIVILQNKIKREHDFVHLSKIYSELRSSRLSRQTKVNEDSD